MSRQTNERAFETHVEQMLANVGWRTGTNAEWSVEHALFAPRVFAFLEEMQPKLWTEMRALHGTELEKLLLGVLAKELDHKGAMHVLRHGFALANPLDKFELGIRKLIEDLMIERMGENDKIVIRYMADTEFQGAAFPVLAREIFRTIHRDRLPAEPQ
ncbi:MAG TPA: hypothetical protein VFZ65_15190 [Planctomycetota bacterium]|nr:hypothetical protein [Planctomycetota bacterium]